MSRFVLPSRHRCQWVLLAVLVPVLASGCTSIGLDPPDLTLVDLQLEDVTVLESSGKVTVRLANSNPEALKVDGMAFDLRLEGRRIGKALSSESIEVPRLSTATVDAELNVNHLAVVSLIQKTLEAEKISYSLTGKVYVLTELGRRTLRVEKSGIFDFEGTFSDGNSLSSTAGESGGGEPLP